MVHRLRRIGALIALFSILGMLIVACGGNQNQGETGAEQGAATTEAGGTNATATADITGATGAETATTGAEGATGAETATTGAETATAGAEETTAAETATVGTEETTAAETATTGAEGAMGAETATAGAGAAAAITLPAECSNVQLTYWNPFTGPDGPFMGQMVDNFNAANPNVQVTMNTIPGGEYGTQFETAAAANQLPDVAIMWADQVATWAYRGVFRPIDDLAQQIGVSAGDFPEPVWQAGEVAGNRYGIPLDIHPQVMFYNQDLLTAVGINAPPMTREEFEAAAQAMTKEGQNGFMITTGFPIGAIFQTLLRQYGGSAFNEDGSQVAFNSEAGVQALQWMKQAQEKYSQPNLEVDAELNAFKGGTVGMIWNGIWQTTSVTGQGVEFDGRAVPFPQIGDQPANAGGSHTFVRPGKAGGAADQCKDAAVAMFIRYILDNSTTWAQAGQIPALNSVRNSLTGQGGGGATAGGAQTDATATATAEGGDMGATATAGGADMGATATAGAGGAGATVEGGVPLETIAALAPAADRIFLPPVVPGITDAFAPMEEAVSAVMSGQATDIKAALDDAATRANQILAENKTRYATPPGGQ